MDGVVPNALAAVDAYVPFNSQAAESVSALLNEAFDAEPDEMFTDNAYWDDTADPAAWPNAAWTRLPRTIFGTLLSKHSIQTATCLRCSALLWCSQVRLMFRSRHTSWSVTTRIEWLKSNIGLLLSQNTFVKWSRTGSTLPALIYMLPSWSHRGCCGPPDLGVCHRGVSRTHRPRT